jgi:hypothetical protein
MGCEIVLLPFLAIFYVAALATFATLVVPAGAAIFVLGALIQTLRGYVITLKATIRQRLRRQEGEEPAVRQYFYSAGWAEFRTSVQRTHAHAQSESRHWLNQAELAEGSSKPIDLPLGAGLFVAVVAGVIAAYALFGVLILLHAIVLALCITVASIIVGVLRGAELLAMAIRRIYRICPSRDCHRRVALPVYGCPACGAVHRALMPGMYGAVRRRCLCGTTLPTLAIFGRGRLPAFCPHASCGKPLNEAIGTVRSLHIPVVGGPLSGKTSFLAAAMLEIQRRDAVEMKFPDRADCLAFEQAAERFAKGIAVDKTNGASPNATVVWIADAQQKKSLLCIYDAAGELYAGTTELRRQNFFTHASAMAMLVDPFPIEQFRVDRASATPSATEAAAESPQNVYGRLISTLREQHEGERIDIPLAIILTKADILGIAHEIELPGAREWLVRLGEGNLVLSAEHDFRDVRFFACSALGRAPSAAGTEAFVPRGVMEPFQWLAKVSGVHLQ